MRRLILALCCASTTLLAQQSRLQVALPGYLNKFPIEDIATPFTLDAPLGKSYAALKASFADLKVPLDVDDPVHGILGRANGAVQLTFAGSRMSSILDCGENTLGGPRADSYRVTVVLLALVDSADATHTNVRVGFAGGAVPSTGSSRDGVQCGSKGVLEAKLMEAASKHLK